MWARRVSVAASTLEEYPPAPVSHITILAPFNAIQRHRRYHANYQGTAGNVFEQTISRNLSCCGTLGVFLELTINAYLLKSDFPLSVLRCSLKTAYMNVCISPNT
jgi:hypothetical protein